MIGREGSSCLHCAGVDGLHYLNKSSGEVHWVVSELALAITVVAVLLSLVYATSAIFGPVFPPEEPEHADADEDNVS